MLRERTAHVNCTLLSFSLEHRVFYSVQASCNMT